MKSFLEHLNIAYRFLKDIRRNLYYIRIYFIHQRLNFFSVFVGRNTLVFLPDVYTVNAGPEGLSSMINFRKVRIFIEKVF